MNGRIEILNSLLSFDRPIDEIYDALSKFPWDTDESVVLQLAHVRQILERYLSGDLDEAIVEAWANAIECRDDVDFSQNTERLLEALINELANPLLTQKLTQERAEALISRSKQ